MRQNISVEQLDSLNDTQFAHLVRLWEPDLGDAVIDDNNRINAISDMNRTTMHPPHGCIDRIWRPDFEIKKRFAPLPGIGQLIAIGLKIAPIETGGLMVDTFRPETKEIDPKYLPENLCNNLWEIVVANLEGGNRN